ncbi:uncharacterized protein LOC143082305 isoform X1 [Mytilus galloprovincialis]|uniref:uncharacterized protein LOC143082305 isoform X1 n=1 Tax=Mytilus galloprovincialis TaxID=29158 RepID=UPI003F7BA384
MPQIRTFCRIKPTGDYYPEFEVSHDTLSLRVPELLRDYNNPKANNRTTVHHEFHFNYIFKNVATQEEVFDVAAKDIVAGFLDGFNGTIFAYGQTGTGKTFTVEGYGKQYEMRGLEPRSLSMIYKALEKRTDEEIDVHISYMEIYQEVGYDLLNPNYKQQNPNTPFPRVHVLEGTGGVWVVRNLSVHKAPTEEIAQQLLQQGQLNRKVAATSVHDRSSRSHAVFTIQMTSKKPGSDTLLRSKLHLVDLAGSERVSKTGVQGHQLNEAKCINLSLHYLETVIIALQGESAPPSRQRPGSGGVKKSRYNLPNRPATAEGTRVGNISKHVPYRNSLLTMVLRDSLGGNCMTSMIATISLEYNNLGESISTCRFAGRVACIANSVSGRIWRNEQLDEKSLIKKLKKKVAELETELSCLRLAKEVGNAALDGMNTKLTDEDKIMCAEIIQGYLGGKVPDPITAGITNPQKFRECMKLLRGMIREGQDLNLEFSNNNKSIEYHKNDQNWRSTDNHLNKKNIRSITHNQSQTRRRAFEEKKVLTSNEDPEVDVLRVHPDTRIQQNQARKEVEIPITNAWTADTREAAQKPVRRKPRQPVRESTLSDEENREDNKPQDPVSRLTSLLEAHKRRSRKYQTPFEKKRVKEIKTLNSKVHQMQQEKLEKEEEIIEMKLNLATQELDMMEQEIKTNLDVTKDQVTDQHAYVQQLRSTEADPNLVEQEKLVEKQLRKRQAKFDKKLEFIDEKRQQLNEQSEHIMAEIGSAKPTIVDKFGKFRKHDGTLNTRQVYDLLRNEEKKHERAQTDLDREKYMVLSRQLEMKEEATRQKLQEFKEMLRMSKSAGYPDGLVLHNGDRNMNTAPAKGMFMHREPSRHASRHASKPVQIVEQKEENYPRSAQTRASDDTFVTAKSDFDRDEDDQEEYPKSAVTRVSGATFFTAKSNFDRPPSRASLRSFQSSIPDSDFYAKRKQEKDPTVRWESAFSRPPSSAASRQASVADFHSELKRNAEKEVQFLSPEYMTDDYKSSSRKSERRREISSDQENGFESEPEETMLPSNYVYGMNRGDKFDARKMGLASNTFDSALASMLDKSESNVYYDHEDYNDYARNTNPSFFGEVPNRKSRGTSRQRSDQIQAAYGVRQGRSRDRQSSRDSWLRQSSHSRERKSTSRDRKTKSRDRWRDKSMDSDYSDAEQKKPKPKTPNIKYRNWGPMARETSILDRLASTSIKTPEKKTRTPSKSKEDKSFDDMVVGHNMKMEYVPKKANHYTQSSKPQSAPVEPANEVENAFQSKVQSHKERVAKIRKARRSAELIQRAWRNYIKKKNKKRRY